MRWPAVVRKTHKWLALVVALQAVFWTVGGVYMTAIHIDIIHGDRLVKPASTAPLVLEGLVEPAQLAAAVPGFESASLTRQLGRPLWLVKTAGGPILFDAANGQKLSPLGEAEIRARAKALFAEDGDIVRAEPLTKVPLEIQNRPAPVWRVEFEGAWRPTFYISPQTGELVARRHDLWRIFDVLWMLHIMDYDDRQDADNLLMQAFSCLAILAAVSGAWLLLYSFHRRRREAAA